MTFIVFVVIVLFHLVLMKSVGGLFRGIYMPLNYDNDAVAVSAFIQTLSLGDWLPFGEIRSIRLGAPYEYNMSDYPSGDQLQFCLFKLIALFTHNTFVIYNIYYILCYILCGLAFFALARFLGIKRGVSILISISYAFLPYHFQRYSHLFLSAYYFVPFYIFVVLKLFSLDPPFTSWINREELSAKSKKFKILRQDVFIAIGLFMAACTGVYYSFFFCIFLSAGVLIASCKGNWRKPALCGVVSVFLIMVASLMSAAPSIIYQKKHGKNFQLISRDPRESEITGLKLTNLIFPPNTERIRPFGFLGEKYIPSNPGVEGAGEYMGILSVFGLILLLVNAIVRSNQSTEKDITNRLASLVLVGVLYGSIGGFSMIFACLVSPIFRSPNRISVFIAAFCLLACGNVLQRLFDRLPKELEQLLPLHLYL